VLADKSVKFESQFGKIIYIVLDIVIKNIFTSELV